MGDKKWQEEKKQILEKMKKIKAKITISRIQKQFSLSFLRAKEVFDEYNLEKYALDNIIRQVSLLYTNKTSQIKKNSNPYYCYMDKQIELLHNEFELIWETNNQTRIWLSIIIKNKLEEMNIPFCVSGNLASSYFSYLYGLHDVDTLKYNIKPEMCYGVATEAISFPLDFHIPKEYESKAFDILCDTIFDVCLYEICDRDENTNDLVLIDYKYAFSTDKKIKEKVKTISIGGKEHKCLLYEDVWKNDNIVEINMICDIDSKEYNQNITFDVIDKRIEEEKGRLVDAIDYCNEISEDIKKSIADSVHSSYDLALWFGLLHSSYYNQRIPSSINELEEVVYRDDIYNYLLASGIEKEKAYRIATKIRKGRYCDVEEKLKETRISRDELEKYKNIKYVLPKGHGLESVLNIARMIMK